MVDLPVVHERLVRSFPGCNFITGTFYLTFEKDNNPYANSEFKAVPVIVSSSQPLSDENIRRITYNFLSK